MLLGAVGAAAQQADPRALFPLAAERAGERQLVARWEIPEDHYLYRGKLDFQLVGTDNAIAEVTLPSGTPYEDEFLGRVEVYRDTLQVHIEAERPLGEGVRLRAQFQGCNEAQGVCYPPTSVEAGLGARGRVA
ncbi:hypothetical protein CKO13_01060, partial [Halorhodospira neutriphila]|nr:hypothetical protein [Halorhodospira neutriphila]